MRNMLNSMNFIQAFGYTAFVCRNEEHKPLSTLQPVFVVCTSFDATPTLFARTAHSEVKKKKKKKTGTLKI